MAASRGHIGECANLPEYTSPREPTVARKLIATLAERAPEEYVQSLDANIEKCLPPGCKFQAIYPHGSSYWTTTAAIATTENGKPRKFFLKLTRGDVGLVNLVGEYTSIQTINAAVRGFSPTPIAVGTYAADPDVHFYLASHVDMTGEVAEVHALPAKLAELHVKAVSPNGKFGFSVPSDMGACTQPNKWTSSWERCFSRMLNIQFEFEQQVHGHNEDMQRMYRLIVDGVIPRLLRPLETEGRSIKPRFVHGDLWDGNTSTDAATDQAIIFDASGSYAHSEYELGAWNLPRHKIYRSYIEEYQRHLPPSNPEEDFEDRLMLYRLRFNLTSSGCRLDDLRFRALVIEDMQYLTDKFKDGYRGTAAAKSEEESVDTQEGRKALHEAVKWHAFDVGLSLAAPNCSRVNQCLLGRNFPELNAA